MNLQERAASYAKTFPEWPAPRADERWMDGMWVLGQDYRSRTSYYGAYPPNYIERVLSLFPEVDRTRVLHLFSGSLPGGTPGIRVDINPEREPDLCCDAEKLSESLPAGKVDLILADPPYSESDALRYGTCMINRAKVMAEAAKVLPIGGNLVWLDQVLPMFSKKQWHLWGLIGIVRSTNHRFRVASMFAKVADTNQQEEA